MRNGGVILWLSDVGTEGNNGFGLKLKLISVLPLQYPGIPCSDREIRCENQGNSDCRASEVMTIITVSQVRSG